MDAPGIVAARGSPKTSEICQFFPTLIMALAVYSLIRNILNCALHFLTIKRGKMRPHKLFLISTLWSGLLLPAVPGLHAEQAAYSESWNSEHFSMAPTEIIQAFPDIKDPESSEAVILLMETRYTFDSQGRSVCTRYLIYKITSPAAVDGWSRVEQIWSPWYQERPELRARVITEDEREFILDPKTIAKAPAVEISPDIYSNRQVLRAPLPGVNVGSIVEEEIVIR
jgi:hypothetical protein